MKIEEKDAKSQKILQLLYIINRLNLKSFRAKTKEALSFVILNDTVHMAHYNNALLWNFEKRKPALIGVSGRYKIEKTSTIINKWTTLLTSIGNLEKPQVIYGPQFQNQELWKDVGGTEESVILWLPIIIDNKLALGLWLEVHDPAKLPISSEETLQLLNSFLIPAYGTAWENLKPRIPFRAYASKYSKYLIPGLIGAMLLLGFVRIPLRIVAPCEIIPKDPYLVTAPLDGIIAEIIVKPGENVRKGDLLFEYDKRIPLQSLKVAEKEVEMVQSELNRAINMGQKDDKSLSEMALLQLKLKKERINLDLANYQASRLSVKAPFDGIVVLDDPDNWRGKPVKVGEKVLIVTDPKNTKVLIWIPESDNVALDPAIPVKVFLNVNPYTSYKAKLSYIANSTTISAHNVPSFLAEANWIDHSPEIKLGLKGTAVLYGENVSLFYYLIRKPWATFRYYVGI